MSGSFQENVCQGLIFNLKILWDHQSKEFYKNLSSGSYLINISFFASQPREIKKKMLGVVWYCNSLTNNNIDMIG